MGIKEMVLKKLFGIVTTNKFKHLPITFYLKPQKVFQTFWGFLLQILSHNSVTIFFSMRESYDEFGHFTKNFALAKTIN